MTDLFQEPIDATALSPTERNGLLQTWIIARAELNMAEAENILNGATWARRRRGSETADLLNEEYAKALHKQMFGDVWNWAGTYRKGESNIGDVDPYRIQLEVRALFDDVRYWLEHETYERDETAVRLHHRLVAIHPFPNGNGRHTRLMADLLIEKLGGELFSWGAGELGDTGPLRERYIAALRTADGHDIGPLLTFARS